MFSGDEIVDFRDKPIFVYHLFSFIHNIAFSPFFLSVSVNAMIANVNSYRGI